MNFSFKEVVIPFPDLVLEGKQFESRSWYERPSWALWSLGVFVGVT